MNDHDQLQLQENRYFSPDPRQGALAGYIFNLVRDLPLICPHGHVDPHLFSDPDYSFGSPVDLLIVPDHYIFRMLYSQGIHLESLGIPAKGNIPVEKDNRKIWQIFADHFYLFRGTPTGSWLNHEFYTVFNIREKLNSKSAQKIYDQIADKLATSELRPRKMYEKFNIEVLCTTDPATDLLTEHKAIRSAGWKGKILPTFRPDHVVDLQSENWRENIDELSSVSGIDIHSYRSFLAALQQRRTDFKEMGATCTDHAVKTAYTGELTQSEAERIFTNALKGNLRLEDSVRFMGNILIDLAKMSIEDGLVMQIHIGSHRDYNPEIFRSFGKDKGGDIPLACELTENLKPLLDRVGNDPNLTLVLFALDETVYSREMATLAGHFPVLKIGPPWWFHDSPNGIHRFLENVSETAGIYNLAGFNDDTRAFPSIPARHDVWRRVCSDWLAGLVLRGRIDLEDAEAMIVDLSYSLAKTTYKL
jgi:glucuronate isomerase